MQEEIRWKTPNEKARMTHKMFVMVVSALGLANMACCEAITGKVTWKGLATQGGQLVGCVENNGFSTFVTTDNKGFYRCEVKPGTYSVDVAGLQTFFPSVFSGHKRNVRVSKGKTVQVNLSAKHLSIYERSVPVDAFFGVVGNVMGTHQITGKGFLIGPEQPGYGLYSYLLFGSAPTATARARYLSAIDAVLKLIPSAKEFDRLSVPHTDLNLMYIPVFPLHKNVDFMNPNWALNNYDYARSRWLLSRLREGSKTNGPYIISVTKPLSQTTPGDEHFLFQDLSGVPESIMTAWIKEFLVEVSKEHFWEPSAMQRFVLSLRTHIEVAAMGLPDVKAAGTDWKGYISSLVEYK